MTLGDQGGAAGSINATKHETIDHPQSRSGVDLGNPGIREVQRIHALSYLFSAETTLLSYCCQSSDSAPLPGRSKVTAALMATH